MKPASLFAALFAILLSLVPSAGAEEQGAVTRWSVIRPPYATPEGDRERDGKIFFNKTVILAGKDVLLDLYHHPVLTIRFPEMAGVVEFVVKIRANAEDNTTAEERFVCLTPEEGSRTVRIDFSPPPAWLAGMVYEKGWNGIGRGLAIELMGDDAHIAFPVVTAGPATIATRMAVFAERWVRPMRLKGLSTNLFVWPDFLGVPTVTVIGFCWLAGALAVIVRRRSQRRPAFKTLAAWSLVVWVLLDVTVKWNALASLPRVTEMKGRFADTIAFLPAEADRIARILREKRITELGLHVKEDEDVYLRFALLPARAINDYRAHTTLLVQRDTGARVVNGYLWIEGKGIMKNVQTLAVTDSFRLIRGERL